MKNKTNQLLRLQQSLQDEIFQKEILMGEKDTLVFFKILESKLKFDNRLQRLRN